MRDTKELTKRLRGDVPSARLELEAADLIESLLRERDEAVASTHRQALCMHQCAAAIGPETSFMIDGLPKAVRRIMRERGALLGACRTAVMALAHASESEPACRSAYDEVSAAIAALQPGSAS